MSERFACKAVGLARCTDRRIPFRRTAADPDADPRAWLRTYSTAILAMVPPCLGGVARRRAPGVNKKKVHRLWSEEGRSGGCTARGNGQVVVVPACGGRGCAEGGRGPGSPVRLYHRRQGDQDRVDDRRTHPANRCWTSRNARSPPSGSSPNRRRVAPRPADDLWCCGWRKDRSLLPSAGIVLRREGWAVLDPAGTPWKNAYIESFNTGYEGKPRRNDGTTCSKPASSSATSSASTMYGIAIRRWVIRPWPSTLPDAATPITAWPARSTEPNQTQPGSRTGSRTPRAVVGLQYG